MTETITLLRPKGEGQSALARVDRVAVQLLVEGQAASLQEARIAVILNNLRGQRDQMTALLADLRGREPTGYAQIDDADATLITAINQGLVQIDLFIARALCAGQAAEPSSD